MKKFFMTLAAAALAVPAMLATDYCVSLGTAETVKTLDNVYKLSAVQGQDMVFSVVVPGKPGDCMIILNVDGGEVQGGQSATAAGVEIDLAALTTDGLSFGTSPKSKNALGNTKNYWTLTGTEPANMLITWDYWADSMTVAETDEAPADPWIVNVPGPGSDATATINFTGVQNAFQYVCSPNGLFPIVYDQPSITITLEDLGNNLAYEIQDQYADQYEITGINCTTNTSDDVLGAYAYWEEDGLWHLNLQTGAADLVFEINVEEKSGQAPTATFNFEGIDNAWQFVIESEEMDWNPVSGASITLPLNNEVYRKFAVAFDYFDYYEISDITCEQYPGQLSVTGLYTLYHETEFGDNYWTVTIDPQTAGEDLVFTVTVSEAGGSTVEFLPYLGVNYDNEAPTTYDDNFKLEQSETDEWSWEGTFTFQAGAAINLWLYTEVDLGDMDYVAFGPMSGDAETLMFEPEATLLSFTAARTGGYWVLGNDQECEIKITYTQGDIEDIITFDCLTPIVAPAAEATIDLNFTGVENAHTYVTVRAITEEGEDSILVDSDEFSYTFAGLTNIVFTPVEGATISIESADGLDDETLNEYEIYIMAIENEEMAELMGVTVGTWVLEIDDPEMANTLAFNINVTYEGQDTPDTPEEPKEVALTFGNFNDKNDFAYPGLVESLAWDGVTTNIAWDDMLLAYNVTFAPGVTEGLLLITFTNDYTVSAVSVASTRNGQTTTANPTVVGNEAAATIYADATKTVITFTAKANPSGISSINAIDENAAIYNLQGVRVDRKNLVKGGIYIVDGKKVAVK